MNRRRAALVGVLAVALVATGTLPASATTPRAGENHRIQGPAGEPDERSFGPDITPDGRYVAFVSGARNLLDGPDEAAARQVYVADRHTGTIERVSMTHDGGLIAGSAHGPSISADGRYVAYWSSASNVVPGIDNFQPDVFVHDRATASTERISVTHDGQEVNGSSADPAISADGRYVAYQSTGTRIVPDRPHPGAGFNIFRYDRVTGQVVQVSIGPDGEEPNGGSHEPAINGDGSVVAFWSEADNLVAGDNNDQADVFVRDLDAEVTEIASVAGDGTQGNLFSLGPSLDADGRYVAFDSIASNLVPEANSGANDVYVHDRLTRNTERISLDSAGGERRLVSAQRAHISADARYVAYDAAAFTLGRLLTEVFVHDRLTGATELVSIGAEGDIAEDSSFFPTISADGRHVAFESRADNLVPGGTRQGSDVYVRDRGPEVGVGNATAARTEDVVTVAGWATFSGAVLGEAVAEPLVPEERSGLQLTAARVVYRPERGDLFARLDVAGMPAVPPLLAPGVATNAVAGAPGVVYGLSFNLDGIRHELRAARSAASAAEQAFAAYRCDPVCLEVGEAEGSIGHAGQQVRLAAPLASVELTEGSTITELRAFVGPGELVTGAPVASSELQLGDAILPERSVRISLLPPGDGPPLAAETVALDGPAFSVAFPAAQPVAEAEAVGCLGETCGPPLRLAVDPIEPPAPDPEITEVGFTEASMLSGQFSDESFFEARLTDFGGDPIAGETLTFTLSGEESSRDFVAITDQGGIASVSPTLTEKPGPYQLTARYDGDENRAASAATTAFVVERKDTDLELTIVGSGQNMTLRARLAHLDSPSQRVAERNIDFYSDSELIGSETTDSSGIAEAAVPPGHRGASRTYEAVFEGDDFYAPSSDDRPGRGGGQSESSGPTSQPGRSYRGTGLPL